MKKKFAERDFSSLPLQKNNGPSLRAPNRYLGGHGFDSCLGLRMNVSSLSFIN